MTCKSVTTIMIAILAIIVATTTTATSVNVKASNNGCSEKELIEEILCGVGDAARGAGNGYNDGNSAGVNGQDDSCPQSDSSSAYCLAWALGYHDGATDRKNVEKNTDDTPKRTIGDDD